MTLAEMRGIVEMVGSWRDGGATVEDACKEVGVNMSTYYKIRRSVNEADAAKTTDAEVVAEVNVLADQLGYHPGELINHNLTVDLDNARHEIEELRAENRILRDQLMDWIISEVRQGREVTIG